MQRQRLEALLRDETLNELTSIQAMQWVLENELTTEAMVDLTLLAMLHDAEGRYAMLAEPDPGARAAFLEAFLLRTRRTLEVADRFGSTKTDEGYHLN